MPTGRWCWDKAPSISPEGGGNPEDCCEEERLRKWEMVVLLTNKANVLMWKNPMPGYVYCTAPSLSEREKEGEAGGEAGSYLNSNAWLLALRAGNQAAKKAMAVAVTATNIKSVAIILTGK